MESDNLEIGLLYINCLLDLARADDVIAVADKLLEKRKSQAINVAKALALRAVSGQKNPQNLPTEFRTLPQ